MKRSQLSTIGLSDGIINMPRRLTPREKAADSLFFVTVLVSWLLFIPGGIVGYAVWGWPGSVVLVIACIVLGLILRRSAGLRGPDQFHGYYRRRKERANGGRIGLLELLIERLRGNPFTREKCAAITAEYDKAMQDLRSARTDNERGAILKRLDRETKRISYAK
ncbi:MAG TPA: hypothetical protein VG897_18575 [Terriglobales bacterium]|nr:hypothetical protein [Terriglobales bacterium]